MSLIFVKIDINMRMIKKRSQFIFVKFLRKGKFKSLMVSVL